MDMIKCEHGNFGECELCGDIKPLSSVMRRREWQKFALQGEYVMAIKSLRAYGGV
jgi:hypothetical protein